MVQTDRGPTMDNYSPTPAPDVPQGTVQLEIEVAVTVPFTGFTLQGAGGIAASSEGELGIYGRLSGGATTDFSGDLSVSAQAVFTDAPQLSDVLGPSDTTTLSAGGTGGLFGVGHVEGPTSTGGSYQCMTIGIGVAASPDAGVSRTFDQTRGIILNERE